MKKQVRSHARSTSLELCSNSLDVQLKRRNGPDDTWDDLTEADFVKSLNQQLHKVYHFQENKLKEINESLTKYEVEVKDLIDASRAMPHDEDEESGPGHESGHGDDTDSEDDEAFEGHFSEIEQELENLIADVHDLSTFLFFVLQAWLTVGAGQFTALNHTGFIKITKVRALSVSLQQKAYATES